MKYSTYNIYNNPPLVALLIYSILQKERKFEIGRLAILLPLLLDTRSVEKINEGKMVYRNIVTLHRRFISNYNQRYSSIMPIMMDALSLLLELKALTIIKDRLHFVANETLSSIVTDAGSMRLIRAMEASQKIINDTRYVKMEDMYNYLNVT